MGGRTDGPSVTLRHVCVSACVCVCVLHALILVFRGAPLPVPTCVNTAADHMADNDFQIDTLHSSRGEKSMSADCFFPKTMVSARRPLSVSFCLCPSRARTRTQHSVPFILLSMRLHQTAPLFTGDLAADGRPPSAQRVSSRRSSVRFLFDSHFVRADVSRSAPLLTFFPPPSF